MPPFTEPVIPRPAPAPRSHAWDQSWFLRQARLADQSRYGRRTTVEETALAHGGDFIGARIEARHVYRPKRGGEFGQIGALERMIRSEKDQEYLLLLAEPWTFQGPGMSMIALALIVNAETTWAYTTHQEAREAWSYVPEDE